jgi:hypothetical protein
MGQGARATVNGCLWKWMPMEMDAYGKVVRRLVCHILYQRRSPMLYRGPSCK